MNERAFKEETQQEIVRLYQNREHEALEEIGKLLPVYQSMIQALIIEQNNLGAVVYLEALKRLLECYQAQDMIGMADILTKDMTELITVYHSEQKRTVGEEGIEQQ